MLTGGGYTSTNYEKCFDLCEQNERVKGCVMSHCTLRKGNGVLRSLQSVKRGPIVETKGKMRVEICSDMSGYFVA